jgi:thiol-disulfide isomerase/thioredoxin
MHIQQIIKRILLLTLLVVGVALVLTPLPVRADAEEPEIIIYFFWGEGCPFCDREKLFFEFDLLPRYDNVIVLDFETYNSRANANLFLQLAETYGFKPQGVPATFVGDRYFVGFSQDIGVQIENTIKTYMDAGVYPDPGLRLPEADRPALPTKVVPTSEVEPTPVVSDEEPTATPQVVFAEENPTLEIPLIGTVDLSGWSLLASTVLIAVVDGFNPCSLWVLTMLIALSLHTGSRKKVFIIGFVFLTVTAAVYMVFIAGLFSMMRFFRYVIWIQVLVALIAGTFALINIKDYFWYKEGVSMTIADDKKPGIFKKMRKVVSSSDNFWAMIGATIVLALGVSVVEFSCTAGLPVLWTGILNAQGVEIGTFLLLLLVYMVIYQLDEMIIFVPAVLTLRSSKFEEKQGRLLKLVGGVLMLSLAIVLLVDPGWMHELVNVLILFGGSLGVTGLILLLHRVILPMFGVEIGSDAKKEKANRRRR